MDRQNRQMVTRNSRLLRCVLVALAVWLAACRTPPVRGPAADGKPSPVSATPATLRVAVASPRHPEALFETTKQLTEALANAGSTVTHVDGFSTSVLLIKVDTESLAHHGCSFAALTQAVRGVLPEGLRTSMEADEAAGTVKLEWPERHWDPALRPTPGSLEALQRVEIPGHRPCSLQTVAGLHRAPGASQASHGDAAVLFVHLAAGGPPIDLQRFLAEHPGVTIDRVAPGP